MLIAEANLYLYKETVLKRESEFEQFNATHMKATIYSLFYLDGEPTVYTIKIEIIDVAANEVIIEEAIEDRQNVVSFGTLAIILSAIFVVGLAFRKRKR